MKWVFVHVEGASIEFERPLYVDGPDGIHPLLEMRLPGGTVLQNPHVRHTIGSVPEPLWVTDEEIAELKKLGVIVVG